MLSSLNLICTLLKRATSLASLQRPPRSFVSETRLRYCVSVIYLERRAVLRPRAAVIVDARGGDVGVAEPLLHLGDVGLVVERVGGGRRAQRMGADLETEQCRIGPHQPINAVAGDCFLKPAGAVVADRPEQRTVFIGAVSGGIEIIVDERVGARMQRQIPRLAALAGDLEMRHALPRVLEVLDLELAQFLAPQRVEQQRGQDGAVAFALDGVLPGSLLIFTVGKGFSSRFGPF